MKRESRWNRLGRERSDALFFHNTIPFSFKLNSTSNAIKKSLLFYVDKKFQISGVFFILPFSQKAMNSKAPRKKIPVKSIFHHVIRAKIYSILTLNALEGMMYELDHTLDQEYSSCMVSCIC